MGGKHDSTLTGLLLSAIEDDRHREIGGLTAGGADPNGRTRHGWTFLTLAISLRNEWVVDELIAAGADVNLSCDPIADPAAKLVVPGQRNLRVQPELNPHRAAGWTPLMESVRVYANNLIRLLMDHRADINAKTFKGHTALMEAAALGFDSQSRALLELGAAVDMENDEGWTALHYATARGFVEVMRELINARATINRLDNQGTSPLMRAVRASREAVDLLLEHGANVTVTNRTGASALSYAIELGDTSVVGSLLEKGADKLLAGRDGAALIRKAESGPTRAVALLLRECRLS